MARRLPLDNASGHRGGGLRTDIQGLRAIAVAIVVAYHLAPGTLRGGFVGVDVFFVISGFLITAHLLAHPPARRRDFAGFWSRRIRRLLPAALLVLAATLVASRLIAPQTQWANTATQIRAAALYMVNWRLAGDAVDYLAAESAATPVQHFWSLSVEEQFYFVWPLLIGALVAIATLLRRHRTVKVRYQAVLALGLGGVVLASLLYSIHETRTSPPAAYFVTPTRMWELGLGGLVALFTAPRVFGRGDHTRTPPRAVAAALGWLGVLAIAWTAWAYSQSTPFPGYQAALPVVGGALVIIGHPRRGGGAGLGTALAIRPMQWLGDVSYSVYLWHWPLIVLVPQATGHALDAVDRVLIVVATLALAGLTKILVEDRFRTPSWGRPLVKPYLLAAAGMAVVVGLGTAQIAEVSHLIGTTKLSLTRALKSHDPCLGAAALDPGKHCEPVPFSQVVPAPVQAAADKSDAYADVSHARDCSSYLPGFPMRRCTFGSRPSRVTIALVGNSHASQWLPALQELARRHHWRIDTYLASRCALAENPQDFDTSANTHACQTWVRRTTARIVAARPDLVVMTNRISSPAVGTSLAHSGPAYAAGYRAVLNRFKAANLRVLALHDTPAPGFSVPDCVAEHQDDYTSCAGSPKDWIPADPIGAVVRSLRDPRIGYADLNRHICSPTSCGAVTGGVITYFDGSHLTASFNRTLAPYLDGPV
jgi:peptidoglycan/LPS O-acetylase OafA/YrhL